LIGGEGIDAMTGKSIAHQVKGPCPIGAIAGTG
jgi:hypothetical protein